MANNTAWLRHLKKVRNEHPNMEWSKVLKKASKTYKPPAAKKPVRKTYPNKRPYNYGRAWHADRHQFNKNEDWEIPPSDRKVPLWR